MLPNVRLTGILAAGALALSCAFFLVACSREEIEVHTVPKGSESIAAEEPVGGGAAAAVTAPRVDFVPIWTVPPGWREVGDAPAMRLTTFVFDGPAGEVEVAVSRFPGDVGGLLANVNRWRGQVGLPPAVESDLDEMVERFSHPGFEGYAVHLAGPEQHMLAAGVFEVAEGRTWFVRVITDAATAAAVKDEVFAFARSFGAGGGV